MLRYMNFVLAVLWSPFAVGCCGLGTFVEPGDESTSAGNHSGGPEEFTPAMAPYQLAIESVDSFQKPRGFVPLCADKSAFHSVTRNKEGEWIRRKYSPAGNQTSDEPISSRDWFIRQREAVSTGKWALVSFTNNSILANQLGVLDTTSGEIRHAFDPKRATKFHAISADGKKVVAAFYAVKKKLADVTLFNAETGEAIAQTQISGVDLKQMSVSADGRRVVFNVRANKSAELPLWETSTNKVRRLAMLDDDYSVVRISPDGKLIAAVLATDRIYPKLVLLNAESGDVSKTLAVDKLPGELVFSDDGKLLMAGWVLCGGTIFDVASGGIVATLETDEVLFEARFTTNGNYLAAQNANFDFSVDHEEMLVWELTKK